MKVLITGITGMIGYHLSKMGRKFGGKNGDCPITENISEPIVRLPLYNDLNFESLDFKCFYEF